MRWQTGAAAIERMLESGELQHVSLDRAIADRLLATAHDHLDSATVIAATDPAGACQMAYDAARKACSALLEAQGLRATSHGGHVAVRDVVVAQFASHAGGQVIGRFDLLRRRRNDLEYPDSDAAVGTEEVELSLEWAKEIVDFADRVVEHLPPFA